MAEDKQQRREEQRRSGARGGIIVGIVLVTLGIIFLLNNLFPGMELNRLWPVIIIVLGLAVLISAFIPPVRGRRAIRGVFWITIGTILLLNTLGIIPFSYWLNLAVFWPVLIIAAGVGVLGGVTRSRVVSALAPIIVLATLVFAVFYHGVPAGKLSSATYRFSHDANNSISWATARVDFAAGNLKVGSTGKLYDIEAKEFTVKEKPQFTFSRSGSSAELSLRPNRGEIDFVGGGRQRVWRVSLSKDIAWDLDLRTGAATGNLDLRDLRVDDLNIKGGVGDISVRFGDKAASTTADINAGVSDIKLMVPKNAGVRLKMNSGISSRDFNNIDLRRPSGSSVYETPNFSHAAKKIMLYVNIGVSSLQVQGY